MDIQLFYREAGAGEPLILLHGNGEDSRYFEQQLSYFSKNYHVIAIDTRGHGNSPRGTAPFRIAQFAEDLHYFMDTQKIKSAYILGFSDGGNIALCFAIKYPQYVKRLILNGANLNGNGVKSFVQLPIIIGYHIASLFASKSETAKRNAELLGLMVNDPNIAPEVLKKVTAKTLVIVGTKDMIKDRHSCFIAEAMPNAILKRIEGNHFIANKNPTAFNQAVEMFLES